MGVQKLRRPISAKSYATSVPNTRRKEKHNTGKLFEHAKINRYYWSVYDQVYPAYYEPGSMTKLVEEALNRWNAVNSTGYLRSRVILKQRKGKYSTAKTECCQRKTSGVS